MIRFRTCPCRSFVFALLIVSAAAAGGDFGPFPVDRAVAATCGNGFVEPPEQCDNGNLTAGDGCSPTCTVEPGYQCTGSFSACVTVCGDNVRTPDEVCDGSSMGGHTCTNIGQGFQGGTLLCNACSLDTSGCCGVGALPCAASSSSQAVPFFSWWSLPLLLAAGAYCVYRDGRLTGTLFATNA